MQTNSFKKKRLCQKSNMCGHIMPTNNLKQVFYQKALVKIEHVRKQSLFVSSGLMVFTQCVYELYIVLSHCAQVGSIAEAAHLTIYFQWGGESLDGRCSLNLQGNSVSQRVISIMGR